MTEEYPKYLHHPGYAPAVISRIGDPPGTPVRFPPVVVHNTDQEEQHIAKGYAPSGPSIPLPTPGGPPQSPHYKGRENIRMRPIDEEDEPPPTYEFPKYVGTEIAYSAEEEADILDRRARVSVPQVAERAPVSAELAALRAEIAALKDELAGLRPAQDTRDDPDDRAEWIALAEEAGVTIDKRWRLSRIREAVEAATQPEAAQ
ncbi:MAG: hypothetical protein ACREDY_00905 [Bradyrhizobium sp.]